MADSKPEPKYSSDDLERYGLGKGIDMSQLRPWSTRNTQCRKVDFPNNSADNIEKTKFDLTTVVESGSSKHGRALIGANVPEAFTKVNIAFDLTRDRTNSRKVSIKCCTTAKYYFKDDESMPGEENVFEQELQQFKNDKESVYGENWCEVFLKKRNNITHYVASITLGAMTCTVLQQSTKADGFTVSAEAEAPKAGQLGVEAGSTTQSSSLRFEGNTVGTFTSDMTEVASPDVVHYVCKPLINLVSDPTLKTALHNAVTQYQVNRDAPYYIFCPHGDIMETTKLYWSLDEVGRVNLTEDRSNAAPFYLRFTSPAEPPYFFITVNPLKRKASVVEEAAKQRNVAVPVVANPDPKQGLNPFPNVRNKEVYISISKKSRFGDEAELKAKISEVDSDRILFEFRRSIAPQVTVNIAEEDMLLLQQSECSEYLRIKPKVMKKDFLTAYHNGFSCKLQLMPPAKSEKTPKKGGQYLALFGIESSRF